MSSNDDCGFDSSAKCGDDMAQTAAGFDNKCPSLISDPPQKHKHLLGAFAALLLFSQQSWADLTPYSQDFETLNAADPAALSNDGWLVFGNVFNAGGFLYGYGPFPAPNGGAGFSAIVSGEGGPDQGAQQLSVYNDYNNLDHSCCLIEANVFQEQTIGAADLGTTWTYDFEAKKGNIELGSTATAFIKVLDQVGGTFSLLAFETIDMTGTPDTWTPYSIPINIDPAWEGQLLQFGALSNATNFEGSGIFYDNINFSPAPAAPSITGVWPGSGTEGEFISIFVFGSGFDTTPGATTVHINGVLQPLTVVVTTDMLIVRTLVDPAIYGPVTVTTANGSAVSDTSFGVPLSGLQLTGVWPGQASDGETLSVFLFGNDFPTNGTAQVFFNGIQQFLVAPVTSEMLIVRSTVNTGMSGLVTVVTPSGSVVSSEPFVVVP